MAPEIIDNKEYTLKADIYSYGVYLYLLLDNNMGNLCKKNPLQ
jgi:serine/threonine protein kinase